MSDHDHVGILAGGERWISISEAQQIWRVSRRTLYNWMGAHQVRYAQSPGGARYIALASMALKLPNGDRCELDPPAGRYEFLDVR